MARVLLIAPTCDGTDIGEAWVAFQWALHLSRTHDLTVLTYHKRGRTPAADQLPGVRVVEWTEPPLVGRAERLNSMLKPAYIPFYIRSRRWIKAALSRGEIFDVVHQPTPVAMRYPSPAIGLDIPLIIGPVGGGLESPAAFAVEEGSAPWFTRLRRIDSFRVKHDPMLRRTYEQASCVVGIAPYVAESLQGLNIKKFVVMSETAIDDLPEPVSHHGDSPIKLLFVGRIIRTKGVADAIRALSMVSNTEITLDVVGTGPDRPNCEVLAAELGVEKRVTFHGAVSKDRVFEHYRQADVFLFPSYREPGGNVVFEAMAFRLPLIVCDRGGPGAAVDDTCAFRLAVTTPGGLARDVATAVDTLESNPRLRLAMGRAARVRLEATALWQSKITSMSRIYDQAVAEHSRTAQFHGDKTGEPS